MGDMDRILMDMGNVLRELRLQAHMTQSEVAARANVNHSYYCQIENGVVNPTIYKFLQVLSVYDFSYLDLSNVIIHDISEKVY